MELHPPDAAQVVKSQQADRSLSGPGGVVQADEYDDVLQAHLAESHFVGVTGARHDGSEG